MLFDLDNTLHDRDEAFVAWSYAFVADHLHVSDPTLADRLVSLIVEIDDAGRGDKLSLFGTLKQLCPAAEMTPPEMLADFFATRTDHMRVDDSVPALLAELHRRELPWGIVTNGGVEQWDKLRALKLDIATTAIIVSSDFGPAKPDPTIFTAAAGKLGVAPEHILFVGDHPVADIAGAQSVGMMTAWLSRDREWPTDMIDVGPDAILDDIGDVASLLT